MKLTGTNNTDAFAVKLRSALQADAEREILNTALDELGMDSLVAIEVRSWFLKELSADIPIFKILKASTPNALLASVWDSLPSDLVPSPLSDEQPQVEHRVQVGEHDKPAVEVRTSEYVQDEEARGDLLASTSPLEADSKSSASSPIPSEDMLDSGSVSSVSEALPQVVNSCERTVPMSFGQSRFWFLSKYIEDQAAFNITVCITLKGDLDVERFKQAFHTVTERHESLRTSYDSAANQPMQTVWKHSNNRFHSRPILDRKQVEEACNAIHKHVYNLKDAETMRIELLSLPHATTHFLILGYHHINMDGIALEILVAEMEKAYNGTPLASDMIQYADFAMRERREYESGQWSSEIEFWQSEFPTPLSPLPLLPLAKRSSRPAAPNYGTLKAERHIKSELSAKILQTCRKFRVTPYHFHLAILSTLLARYTETSEFCIGLGDANRKDPDVRESLGLYLNLVPLRRPGVFIGQARSKLQGSIDIYLRM